MTPRSVVAAILAAWLAAHLTGSITVTTQEATATTLVEEGEVRFGALASGSSVGTNETNASASVNGALISTTTNLWYFNNTNASAAYYAKIVLLNNPSFTDVSALTIGIDNGSASTAQITASLGSLTGSSGAYVRLEPASTVRIYATHMVGLTFGSTTLNMEVYVADSASEEAYYTVRASFSLT